MKKVGPKKIKSPAGYSGKPLVQKLGIAAGMKVLILSPPKDYYSLLGKFPENITLLTQRKKPVDFIHFFTSSRSELNIEFATLAELLSTTGMLWISWPKGSSGTTTDLNENIVREIGLNTTLVDIKVAAIDETWSGLKFVRRKSAR